MDDLLQSATPEGEVTETPSIHDEMLEIVQNIEAREQAEAETPEAKPDRPRDETGKFARGETKPTTDPKASTSAAPAVKGAFEDRGAPTSWRPEAKAQWSTLPEGLKAEVYKREQDALSGIQQYSARAQVADTLMNVISPYQSLIAAAGADVPTALNEVLKTAAVFQVGSPEQKLATLRQLAQRHGVDIGQLTAHSGNDQFRDPVVEELRKELSEVKGQLANQHRASQNSEWQAANSEIAAFQRDPARKYFSDVAVQMGRLMQIGEASTMHEAYEKACLLNPSVKAALELEARQDADRKANEERAARAAAARRAGQLSVRSAPTPRPTTGQATDWQTGMENIAQEIFSRDAA